MFVKNTLASYYSLRADIVGGVGRTIELVVHINQSKLHNNEASRPPSLMFTSRFCLTLSCSIIPHTCLSIEFKCLLNGLSDRMSCSMTLFEWKSCGYSISELNNFGNVDIRGLSGDKKKDSAKEVTPNDN